MGAWGYGIFDDDTAYDFTSDIQEGDTVAFSGSRLKRRYEPTT